jgi:flagellar hook-basal body protein
MLRSLNSGVTGLINHQVRMDVVGNNIANVNTEGYKTRRATFSESFSQLIKGASRSESKAGGTNPMQVGLGVSIGSIDMIMGQGNLQSTGRLLDLGIEGNAFFGVSDGVGTYYTRCGAFQLDSQGYIMLPTNGMVLQGKMADSMGNFPPGTAIGNLQLPLNQQSPAKATTEVSIARNLNADGEAKGSVDYTQRLLHAADAERFPYANGVNDKGHGLHDTKLASLFDGNGLPFNMKEGDKLTMSFYTDSTYETKIEASFYITEDGLKVNRLNAGLPDAVEGQANFTTGIMNINSLQDMMRAIEYTLNSYLNPITPATSQDSVQVGLGSKGELTITGVDSDIFGFSILSNNPNSGKIDESGSVTRSFDFGSYLGPGVLGSQTYTTNGYTGNVEIYPGTPFPDGSTYIGPAVGTFDILVPETISNRFEIPDTVPVPSGVGSQSNYINNSGATVNVLVEHASSPVSTGFPFTGVEVNASGGPAQIIPPGGGPAVSIPNGGTFPAGSIYDGVPNIKILAPGAPVPHNGYFNVGDVINNGGSVKVLREDSITFALGDPPVRIPPGAINNETTNIPLDVHVEKDGLAGVLLRPAEQYDKLADILKHTGEELGLLDGAVISFTATIGENNIDSKPLIYDKTNTLLDDLMMKLRNDLKLPYDFVDKDSNSYPSVGIKAPGLGEDGIPEGALVIRGLPGKTFSINNLVINARNPGGGSTAPSNFIEAMAKTNYRPATNAEVVPTEIAVYDESGAEHILRFEFTHTGVKGEWVWRASLAGKEIINPPGCGSGRITFGQDGTLASWIFDDGSSYLQFDPANGAKNMRIKLDAGGVGNWKGLTQQDSPSTAQAQTQNGYPSGQLLEIAINEFGLIEGAFSNGTSKKLAQIMVVDFANPGGLLDLSDNVYTLSANSGDPIWGKPKDQSSSSLKPGALEMSSVDIAQQFTSMITTQRGYQANSRIITVSDTMLEETVNLKR